MKSRKVDFGKILADDIKHQDPRRDVSDIRSDARGSFRLIDISLDKIKTRPQVRKHIDPDSLLELMASIRTQGLTNPVEVVDSGDHYTLILGHRRLAAFLKLNYATIPAIVRSGLSEEDIIERQGIENLQRDDLNPIEEAQFYAQLMEIRKINQNEVADRIGKSKDYVSRMIGLVKLSKKVASTQLLSKLSKGLLLEFVPYSDESFIEIAINKAIEENLGQKEIRELLKNLKSGKGFDRESARTRRDFEEESNALLGVVEEAENKFMKYQVRHGKKLSPEQTEELKEKLGPALKRLLLLISIYYPGSPSFDLKLDVSKPTIKFPGLDESLAIDTSLLDIRYSFLDWNSSINEIKNFIMERLPDLQKSVFKDFDSELIADYWNAMAFTKNRILKPDGFFYKSITNKNPLPAKYKALKNKAIGRAGNIQSKETGSFDKFNLPTE